LNTLLSTAYLPPISWFSLALKSEKVIIEACEHYQKGSYRNRCHIIGPNGVQKLSIPLQQGKHQQTPIREVKIAYSEPWQKTHWRSICAAYGRAPYFEHYAPDLIPFYQKKYDFLFDFNFELMQFINKKIGYSSNFDLTNEWKEISIDNTLDFRSAVNFDASSKLDFFTPKPYSQVFEEKHGFILDVSIIDILMCFGKRITEKIN
jgi:hypothetical protein